MGSSATERTKRSFTHDEQYFLLHGRPFLIHSGELHYFRIPRPYWRHRLLQARALGLNTICTYMPWNLHEPRPGEFDFVGDGEMLNVAAFIRLAQEVGLLVVLRPGPYICAEWDFGGLPGWLLADPHCRVRCDDSRYLAHVKQFIDRVGDELSPLTIARGGSIIMVQVENEYGSYSNDKRYLRSLRQMLRDAGFDDVLLFTSDGPQSDMLAAGTLDDCLAVANFGSKARESCEAFRKVRPTGPLMCGEFWCGWFDHWGRARQGSDDPAPALEDIRWMLENDVSFNLYMLHGGTNFGFTAGANYYDDYRPTVTSYDYRALVDEAGRPTKKYFAVRELMQARRQRGEELPAIPDLPTSIVSIPVERFRFAESAALFDNLPAPLHEPFPRSMEPCGQYAGGAILYRTNVAGLGGGKLKIVEPHDYAIVYLDGRRVGALDRRLNQRELDLPESAPGGRAQLDILVWAMGRINYGPRLLDRKGITDRVELKHLTLSTWQMFPMPLKYSDVAALPFTPRDSPGPAVHRGVFELVDTEVGDTFLDLSQWSIGCAWVNGHNLGRFWSIGPQQTLYCPGCWLKPGRNEIVVLDLESTGRQPLAGLTEPILDQVKP